MMLIRIPNRCSHCTLISQGREKEANANCHDGNKPKGDAAMPTTAFASVLIPDDEDEDNGENEVGTRVLRMVRSCCCLGEPWS